MRKQFESNVKKIFTDRMIYDEATREVPVALIYRVVSKIEAKPAEFYEPIKMPKDKAEMADAIYVDHARLTQEWLAHTFPNETKWDSDEELVELINHGAFLQVWMHQASSTMTFKRVERDRSKAKFVHPKEKIHAFIGSMVVHLFEEQHEIPDEEQVYHFEI